MAYNTYLPTSYQPGYYGTPYYQQAQQMMQQPSQPQQTPPIQQSGFVLVQSEQEARTYPVAPGNSVTFKDERAPYCYVKTMGFNQLDRPAFEKYRLVKEESATEEESTPHPEYALKTELEEIRAEIKALKAKGENDDE